MIHVMGRFLLESSSRRNGPYETRLILFLFSYPRTAFPLWNTSFTLELPCSRGIEILYNLWKKRKKGTLSGSWERGLHCQCGRKARRGAELFWFLGKFAASIGGCHLRQGMGAVMVTSSSSLQRPVDLEGRP